MAGGLTPGEILLRAEVRNGVDMLLFESGSGADRDALAVTADGSAGSLIIDGRVIPNADIQAVLSGIFYQMRVGEVDDRPANLVEILRSFSGVSTARTFSPTPIEDAYLDSLPTPDLRGRDSEKPAHVPSGNQGRTRS